MRKILILFVAVFLAVQAHAQFDQGRMLVGGSGLFSISTHKSKSGNTTVVDGTEVNFGLTPRFGYFLIDNLAVGAQLSLNLSSYSPKDNDNDASYTSSTTVFGPFARYYFQPGIFGHVEMAIGTSSEHWEIANNSQDYDYLTTQFGLGAGYAIFLNDNVAVEPMILYRRQSDRLSDSDPVIKSLNGTVFISVGFQIYLGD